MPFVIDKIKSKNGLKFAMYVFAANLAWSLLVIFISDHKKCSHPIISHCTQYNDHFFNKIVNILLIRSNITTDWQQNIHNECKTGCHTFESEPPRLLEPIIMEFKR